MNVAPKIFSNKLHVRQFASPGMIILYTLLLFVIILWTVAHEGIGITLVIAPFYVLGNLSGILGMTFLAFNFILVTRLGLLEKIFHGIDKVYIAHDFTGKTAFVLLSIHPVLHTLSFLPDTDFIIDFLLFGNFLEYDLGKFALILLWILVALTVFIKIPYHIWKLTHKFMALPLLFGSLHAVLVSTGMALFPPLKYFMLGLISLAFLAYFYKLVLYRFIAPKVKAVVENIVIKGDVTEIHLKPEKQFKFHPGQFAFISFKNSKSVSSESHPFTLSSSPLEKFLRISPKKSGDYTARLSELEKGVAATIYGPHGDFGRKAGSSTKDMIWIAGGIGITPFLSMLGTPDFMGNKKVALIYSVSRKGEDVYTNEVKKNGQNYPGFRLFNYYSDKKGRLSSEKIIELTGNITDKNILLCGPSSMMNQLADQLIKAGAKPSMIFFEEFALI